MDPATAHAAPAQLRALIATLYKVAFGSHISNHMAVLLAEEDCDIEMEGEGSGCAMTYRVSRLSSWSCCLPVVSH